MCDAQDCHERQITGEPGLYFTTMIKLPFLPIGWSIKYDQELGERHFCPAHDLGK